MVSIQTNHGREFNQDKFIDYCDKHDISYNVSATRTPQQTRAVERKNRTLEDMARKLINRNDLPKSLWVEVVNTVNLLHFTDASSEQS